MFTRGTACLFLMFRQKSVFSVNIMDKICLLIFWAPLLMCVAEQQKYFLHHNASTWDRARIHCQVCYKELVTLTPDNIQSIVQNLTSDYWIGLRKNPNTTAFNSTTFNSATFNSTAFNSTMPWSHWANKAPLTFQNWYPGWPRAKPKPKEPPAAPVLNMSGVCPVCECCCYSGCVDVTTTTVTVVTSEYEDENITISYENETVTDMPTMTTMTAMTTAMETTWLVPVTGVTNSFTANFTESSNRTDDVDDDDDDGYIEDSCVSMLSFGAWIEKHCWEDLPYICYEEGFTSIATFTNVHSKNATVSWQAGPGDISHYRLEVRSLRGDWPPLTRNQTDLTYDLDKLIEGSGYSVQVFPVKCDRDLPSKKDIFYTKPGAVGNLTVTNVTESSIFLSWDPPVGNSDHYYIEVRDHPDNRRRQHHKTSTTNHKVNNLLPGGLYIMDVITGSGESTLGDSVSIPAYTKPGKVSGLKVTDNKKLSLVLHWNPPKGDTRGYRVEAWKNETMLFSETSDKYCQNMTVRDLPAGTKVQLSVVALGNGTLEGDIAYLEGLTTPGPIKNLSLSTTSKSTTSVHIIATWDRPDGSYEGFTVWLQLGDTITDPKNTTNTKITFQDQIKSAANYTLSVTAFNGHLNSTTVSGSIYTKPVKPRDAKVTHSNKSHITLEWTEPINTVSVKYQVKYNASFWNHSLKKEFDDQTRYTFDGLHSGTKYDFEVRTMAGDLLSDPTTVSHCTAPEKKKITLSMVCSSQTALSCDTPTTRTEVLKKLEEHFKELLKDEVFWGIKWNEEIV